MLAWPSLDWVLSYLPSFKVRYRTTQGSVSHFQHEIRTPLSFFTEETTQAPFGLCEEAGLIQRPVHVGSHFVEAFPLQGTPHMFWKNSSEGYRGNALRSHD